MKVTITDVLNQWSLLDQSFTNLLTIELPSGARFQVSVDDEVLKAVLAEASNQKEPYQQKAPPASSRQMLENQAAQTYVANYGQTNGQSNDLDVNPFAESESADELDAIVASVSEPQETPVGWPERQVEHHVESGVVEWATLPDSQLPPSIKRVLTASRINPFLSIEDLNQLKLEIITKMASQPKPGKVDWNSGPRRNIQAVQSRRVSMDEAGNPLPAGGIIEMPEERDPGEVRDEDGDEGVQQA